MQVTVSMERCKTFPLPRITGKGDKKRDCYIRVTVSFKFQNMAERVGFEPTVRCRITGFQDRLLKPLGHLSVFSVAILSKMQENCQ